MSKKSRNIIERLENRQLFSAGLAPDNARLIFSAISGGAPSAVQNVTLTNTSVSPVTIAAGGESIDGADAAEFSIPAALPLTIQPGQTASVPVAFTASRIGPAGATLHILDDDATTPHTDIVLRGLGTKGQFDTLEPSLQWILDTYQIPDNVGASDPTQNVMDIVPLKPNDEVPMNLMEKAGAGPVVVTPIASYSSVASPDLMLGYYNFAGGSLARTQEYAVAAADVQSLNPHLVSGSTQFDPGTSIFGLYTQWPGQKNRIVSTEDFRNTWISDSRLKHAVRFYPLKNADGSVVANSYVMAVEEGTNHDYQDGVFIVQNIRLASPSQSPSGISASTTAGRELIVRWNNNAINAGSVSIERSVNGGAFTPLATLAAGVNRYNDFAVDYGGRYTYRVREVGSDGVTDYSTSGTALVPATYEAESAMLSGPVVQNTLAGHSGSGYVVFQNLTGDSIHWQPTVEQKGWVTLTFHYSNATAAAIPLSLSVNGVVVKSSLAFASTGAATTWRTVSFNVILNAGVNDILLTSIGQGGPNLDSLVVR